MIFFIFEYTIDSTLVSLCYLLKVILMDITSGFYSILRLEIIYTNTTQQQIGVIN